MLEKVLDFQNTSMFLTDTSEDIDAHFRYIVSKKKTSMFFEMDTPTDLMSTSKITETSNMLQNLYYLSLNSEVKI